MTVYCEKKSAFEFPRTCHDADGVRDFLGDQLANGNKLCCANDRDFLNTAQKTRSLGGDFSASRNKISGHDNDFRKHPNLVARIVRLWGKTTRRFAKRILWFGQPSSSDHNNNSVAARPFQDLNAKGLLPAVLKLNSTLAVINSRPIHGNVFFGNAEASVPRNSQRIKNERKAERPTTV